jgi:hypothetical protein
MFPSKLEHRADIGRASRIGEDRLLDLAAGVLMGHKLLSPSLDTKSSIELLRPPELDLRGRTLRRQGCRKIQGSMIAGVFVFLDASSVYQLKTGLSSAKIAPLSWSHISLFRPTRVLPDEVVSWVC